MDEWIWFKIGRANLILPEEKQRDKLSSAKLGFYYVDALKDFSKIKDY